MDYKKLANLLFPDCKLDVEEILKKYPKRNLEKGIEVVRTAPSPTGYLHIGSVYGAFIDKLIAYHSSGIFYMRLEDTDSKREVNEAGEIAYDMLCRYDLKPDEGYRGNLKETGNYGPYVQSKRKDLYIAFAKYLVSMGRAYPCFCDASENIEEILKKRQEELQKNNDLEEKDRCRNLSFEEIEENLKNKKPFAIRLKSEGNGEKTFFVKDLIKGEREIRENSKDIVILKSNFTPPYSLAHVVDDTLMGTTIVVRGEEWYPSLASHLEIFKSLNIKPPKYAHTPVVCKLDEEGNKRKLSKRKDKEADARYFIEKGYPIESVLEYLLNLINSDFEDWRRANKEKSIYDFPFKISKIGSNNPIFDFQKLNDFSKEVIGRFSSEKIYDGLLEYTKNYDKDFYEKVKSSKDFFVKLFSIDREGKNKRKDIAMYSEIKDLYFYMFDTPCLKLSNYQFENVEKKDIVNILNDYLLKYDENDDKEEWFSKIKEVAKKNNFCDNMKEYRENPTSYKGSIQDVSSVLRVAITTRKNTPDLYKICQLLGKEEVLKRIKIVLDELSA